MPTQPGSESARRARSRVAVSLYDAACMKMLFQGDCACRGVVVKRAQVRAGAQVAPYGFEAVGIPAVLKLERPDRVLHRAQVRTGLPRIRFIYGRGQSACVVLHYLLRGSRLRRL